MYYFVWSHWVFVNIILFIFEVLFLLSEFCFTIWFVLICFIRQYKWSDTFFFRWKWWRKLQESILVVPTIQDRYSYHHRLSLCLPRNRTWREIMHSNLLMVRLYTGWGNSQNVLEMKKTFINHVIDYFTWLFLQLSLYSHMHTHLWRKVGTLTIFHFDMQ